MLKLSMVEMMTQQSNRILISKISNLTSLFFVAKKSKKVDVLKSLISEHFSVLNMDEFIKNLERASNIGCDDDVINYFQSFLDTDTYFQDKIRKIISTFSPEIEEVY